jgi:hypothetical protein
MEETTTEPTRPAQQMSMQRPGQASGLLQRGWHWLRGAWPVLLILALPVVLLQHSLFGGGATTGGDILAQRPPWSVDLAGQVGAPQNPVLFDEPYEVSAWFLFTRHELLGGYFPFWNPYAAGGTPFFAADQPAVLYPLTLLGVLLPYPLSMTVMTLFKWWLAGLGMYVFARESLRLGQVAALAAALSFMFSSFIVVWLVHFVGSAAMLLPWTFWASERVIHAPGRKRIALLAVIAALVGVSGHPEMTFHVLLGASLYALWLAGTWSGQFWRARLRRLLPWVGGMALGVALAAVQLLPTIALLPQTIGSSMRSHNYSGIFVPLQGVLTWLVPNLWGNPALNHAYWGPRNYNEEVWYAGAVALALACVALLALRRRERRLEVAFFALLVLVFATLLYRIPPFFWLSRLPVLAVDSWTRLGVLAILGVSALAGFGVEELLAWGRAAPPDTRGQAARATKLLRSGGAGSLPALSALIGLLVLLPALLWVIGRFWRPPHLDAAQVAWEVHWMRVAAALLWATALLVLARGRRWLNRRTIGGLLLGLLLCDQLLFAAPYTPQPSSRLAYPQTPTLTRLQQTVGPARMAASGTLLEPDSLTPYGLRDIRAYDPTASRRYLHFMLVLDPGLGQTNAFCCQFLECPSAVLLGVASVEYYATLPDEDPNHCGARGASQNAPPDPYAPLWTQGGITLWRNALARPRFYFAGQVSPASNEQAALAALPTLGAGKLDAVIEGAAAGTPGSSASGDTLSVLTDLPGQIALRAFSAAPRWVVINEGFDPGWHADLDGAAVEIHPANVMFQAVLVPAGTHTLHLLYRPGAYGPGLALSLAALLVLLVLLASEWVARRWLAFTPARAM